MIIDTGVCEQNTPFGRPPAEFGAPKAYLPNSDFLWRDVFLSQTPIWPLRKDDARESRSASDAQERHIAAWSAGCRLSDAEIQGSMLARQVTANLRTEIADFGGFDSNKS